MNVVNKIARWTFPTNISCFTHLFIIDLQICQWFKAKVVSWTFCCYRLLSVSRFTLCCLAVFFNVLGVNTWFLCYSCLILTIDSTLGVQELGNGNSLLFSCIPFCLWDPGGVLPYMGYMGMCRCEGYGFQAVYSRIGYINQNICV